MESSSVYQPLTPFPSYLLKERAAEKENAEASPSSAFASRHFCTFPRRVPAEIGAQQMPRNPHTTGEGRASKTTHDKNTEKFRRNHFILSLSLSLCPPRLPTAPSRSLPQHPLLLCSLLPFETRNNSRPQPDREKKTKSLMKLSSCPSHYWVSCLWAVLGVSVRTPESRTPRLPVLAFTALPLQLL